MILCSFQQMLVDLLSVVVYRKPIYEHLEMQESKMQIELLRCQSLIAALECRKVLRLECRELALHMLLCALRKLKVGLELVSQCTRIRCLSSWHQQGLAALQKRTV